MSRVRIINEQQGEKVGSKQVHTVRLYTIANSKEHEQTDISAVS